MVSQRIIVINPNSSDLVTSAIGDALQPFQFAGGPHFETVTLKNGPPGIVSSRDVIEAGSNVCSFIEKNPADAYVVACFSDPGLQATRELTAVPVFGIGECSIGLALSMGERFGIIALSQSSVRRQRVAVRSLGLGERYAGSEPVGLTPSETTEGAASFSRLRDAAIALSDQHGANVLILGCAGMSSHCRRLEEIVGKPVVEPTQAAAATALHAMRRIGGGTPAKVDS